MAPTGAPEICQTSVLLTGTTLPPISESEVQHFFYFSGVQYIVIQRQLCHLCKLLYKGTVGCQIDVFSICFYYIEFLHEIEYF